MDQNDTDRDTAPFVMFYNGLDLLGRMIESGCELSRSIMAAAEQASNEAALFEITAPEPADEPVAAQERAAANPAPMPLIPETGDLAFSARAVEQAMNEAARRQLDYAVATDTGSELESAREAVARAKSAISAAKPGKAN